MLVAKATALAITSLPCPLGDNSARSHSELGSQTGGLGWDGDFGCRSLGVKVFFKEETFTPPIKCTISKRRLSWCLYLSKQIQTRNFGTTFNPDHLRRKDSR